MNWIVILISLAVLVIEVCGQLCEKAEDCRPDHCCVASSIAALAASGICIPLVPFGLMCNKPEAIMKYYGGKYIGVCPCEKQLSCMPTVIYNGNNEQACKLGSCTCQILTSTEQETWDEGTSKEESSFEEKWDE